MSEAKDTLPRQLTLLRLIPEYPVTPHPRRCTKSCTTEATR